MTLSKYNEVMDNLVVTEDMRKRLLANVEKEMAGSESSGKNVDSETIVNLNGNKRETAGEDKKADSSEKKMADSNAPIDKRSGKRKIMEFRRYAGIAAAFCVLIVGAYAVTKAGIVDNKNIMSATSSFDAAETAMAPEAEYATETAAAEEAYEDVEEAASETVGVMTAGPDIQEDEALTAGENAMKEADAITPQMAVTEAEQSGKTSNASLAASKFSIFEIFGKNGGEKSAEIKKYASLSALSKAAMTEFKEIEYFDSFSSDKEYHLYDGKVALIYYDVAGNDVVVKEMSTKNGAAIPSKISGITSEMGSTSSVSVGDVVVTLKGIDDTYSVATWTQNGLVYELESSELLTYEDMVELMNEIIE